MLIVTMVDEVLSSGAGFEKWAPGDGAGAGQRCRRNDGDQGEDSRAHEV